MKIGKKLKTARNTAGYTQEEISEIIQVSRQTISNWENEKSYPDIVSVIRLSDLYHISLDELLKGEPELVKHLDDSTNTVKSNKKLLLAVGINVILLFLFVLLNGIIADNQYLMVGTVVVSIISTAALFYQIIRKL